MLRKRLVDEYVEEHSASIRRRLESSPPSPSAATFLIEKTKMTWERAKRSCEARGMLRITSQATNDKVVTELRASGKENGWFDLQRSGGTWKYVDGTSAVGAGSFAFQWNKDNADAPNNNGGNENCVEVLEKNGKWNDKDCNTESKDVFL